MADAAPLPARRRIPSGHRLALLCVWLLAAVPPALWFISETDPELAVQIAQRGWSWCVRATIALAGLLLVAALAFPPVPAWIRLRWSEMRLSVTSDRGPLLRALGELQHFESPQRHLEVGRLALLRREFELAARHLHRTIELDPQLAAAHNMFGSCLLRFGKLDVAAVSFARAEELDPGHAFGDAQLHLGRCLHLLGRSRDAATVLQAHGHQHGGGRKSAYWRGQALEAIGDAAGANTAFAAAAAPPTSRLNAEENWFRALARVRAWRRGRT